MKIRISIDLPSSDKLLAGLAPRDVHPPLVRAEDAAAAAEKALERARADLAEHERRVATMPARVQSGDARVSALEELLRARDARALMIAPTALALTRARAAVAAETKAADAAIDREWNRRIDLLVKAENEIAAAISAIGETGLALLRVRHPSAKEWSCPACEASAVLAAKNRT